VSSASATQASLLALVANAQAAAIAEVAPGARYRDVHMAAARTLAEGLVSLGVLTGDPTERVLDGSIALVFPHGIGHLLGLDVHDMEDLGDLAGYGDGFVRDPSPTFRYLRLDRILKPGMAVTVEPGIYFVPALLDDPENRRAFAGRVRFDVLDRFRDVRGIRIEDDVLVTETGREVLSRAIPHASSAS
jgi:Xaa-Pro aminopeptidase